MGQTHSTYQPCNAARDAWADTTSALLCRKRLGIVLVHADQPLVRLHQRFPADLKAAVKHLEQQRLLLWRQLVPAGQHSEVDPVR